MNAMHNVLPAQMPEAAKAVIAAAGDKKIWTFSGEMGAGKTTLIRSVCRALGVQDEISSPTFSLVNEYISAEGKKIFHFDFYRIRDISEAYDIGYEDYFYSGNICLVEWPAKIAELLAGEDVFEVRIEAVKDDAREIFFS